MGGCGLIGEENIIKLNALGISLFVRPEEEKPQQNRALSPRFLLAALFEQASDKPEYPEIHCELQIWSCKLGMGPLKPAPAPSTLLSWCWLDYLLTIFLDEHELCLSLRGSAQLSFGQGVPCFVGGLSPLEVLGL